MATLKAELTRGTRQAHKRKLPPVPSLERSSFREPCPDPGLHITKAMKEAGQHALHIHRFETSSIRATKCFEAMLQAMRSGDAKNTIKQALAPSDPEIRNG